MSGDEMQEPKKYTARDAMHWMIDHPTIRMTCCNDFEDEKYIHFADGSFYTENLFLAVKLRGMFYVRDEYDAWQAALKAEAEKKKEESEPREGEQLHSYSLRRSGKEGYHSSLQCWIEAYVRRKIELVRAK